LQSIYEYEVRFLRTKTHIPVYNIYIYIYIYIRSLVKNISGQFIVHLKTCEYVLHIYIYIYICICIYILHICIQTSHTYSYLNLFAYVHIGLGYHCICPDMHTVIQRLWIYGTAGVRYKCIYICFYVCVCMNLHICGCIMVMNMYMYIYGDCRPMELME
jgi:hypothetical protein